MNRGPASAIRYARSGAIAGIIATLAFVVVHGVLILNIWFSAAIMSVAGALCGASIAWSFALLVNEPTLRAWIRYNLLYLVMFVALGVTSVLVFEPVTTIAALVEVKGPPTQLIAQALPMTALFLLASSIALSIIYGRRWQHFVAILWTCTVLIALLGLNVSAIGLVAVPRGSLYLVAELFALILLLAAGYAATFIGLEWRTLSAQHGPAYAA